MIFPCMERFFSDFPGFPLFPELMGNPVKPGLYQYKTLMQSSEFGYNQEAM